MPELPEVETTLRGIKPHILQQKIADVVVRHHGLRWPIPALLKKILQNHTVTNAERLGKYLLININKGTLIIHLGMSGSLRILTEAVLPKKHDHLDLCFVNGKCLRYTDPRRFGACLWTDEYPMTHFLLKNLGPEPFSKQFTAEYLLARAEKRKVAIKSFLMDSKIIAGIGNIYATEILFAAGIHPKKSVNKITLLQYKLIVKETKKILSAAIKQGGTTLKDFVKSDGKPGYFIQRLKAYGKAGTPCVKCATKLKEIRLGQRSTVFCPECQRS